MTANTEAKSPHRVASIARRKRSHDVAEEIEQLIRTGYAVGDQLPSEKDLMERFGVGRPAVREALFLLSQQGLVETANGARARVARPGPELIASQLTTFARHIATLGNGLEHIEQYRIVLESGIAFLAAQTATEEDIVRLKAALDANINSVGDVAETARTDIAFHATLASITGNPIFEAVLDALVEWLAEHRRAIDSIPDADRFAARDHKAIFDAVAAHDPARAHHEMTSHLRLVSRLHAEARRIADEVLRSAAHSVAKDFEKEKAELWSESFGRVQR